MTTGSRTGNDQREIASITIAAVIGILCVAALIMVWYIHDPLVLAEDAAQYLSGAQHILSGDGLKTSVLYYESQIGQTVPTDLLVWPPGFPYLISAVSYLTGIEPALAMSLTGTLAVFIAATAIYVSLLKLQASVAVALVGFLAWILYFNSWKLVFIGYADPVSGAFVALSVAALSMATGTRRRRLGWIAIATLLICAALSVKYQSAALIAPIGIAAYLLIRPAMTRVQSIGVAMLATGIPGALFAWLAAGGSIFADSAKNKTLRSLSEVLNDGSWVPEPYKIPFVVFTAGVGLIAAGVGVMHAFRANRTNSNRNTDSAAIIAYCWLGVAAVFAFVYLAVFTDSQYKFVARYFEAVIPLFIIGVLPIASYLASTKIGRTGTHLTVLMVLAGIVLQAYVFAPSLKRSMLEPPARKLKVLLQDSLPTQGVSATGNLSGSAGPVLSNHSQLLSLILDSPTIGIPAPRFQSVQWDEARIRQLIDKHGVQLIMHFEIGHMGDKNVLHEIVPLGVESGWIKPLHVSPQIFIGSVRKPQ